MNVLIENIQCPSYQNIMETWDDNEYWCHNCQIKLENYKSTIIIHKNLGTTSVYNNNEWVNCREPYISWKNNKVKIHTFDFDNNKFWISREIDADIPYDISWERLNKLLLFC